MLIWRAVVPCVVMARMALASWSTDAWTAAAASASSGENAWWFLMAPWMSSVAARESSEASATLQS